jgi:predicted TPR repeat methyltransferase
LTSDFPNDSSSVLTTARQSEDFLENQANELWLIPSNPQEEAARLLGLEANMHKVAGDIDAAVKAYEEKLLVS